MAKEAQEKIAKFLIIITRPVFPDQVDSYWEKLSYPEQHSFLSDAKDIIESLEQFGYRKLPKDKPPLLEPPNGTSGQDKYDFWLLGAQAQREADIEHHEEAKEGDQATLQAKDLSFPNEGGDQK